MRPIFQNRKLIIATMHKKEQVIAPVLEQALGVQCFVDASFNTDEWGTFSREIPRLLDPVAALRQKCLRAMELNNCDLGVASEGSFGPHPQMFFVSANEELLIFIDLKNNIEVVVRELSTATNFNGQTVNHRTELLDFANAAGFPSHGLILRRSKDENEPIFKGITNREKLLETFDKLQNNFQSVYVETDMRALYNPSRMTVIAKAAEQLVAAILSTCPVCEMPGFGISDVKRGLKCDLCGFSTNGVKSHIYSCKHCAHTHEVAYPNGKTTEDPMYCDCCNP